VFSLPRKHGKGATYAMKLLHTKLFTTAEKNAIILTATERCG
jgi:hypothetical protein